MESSNDSSIENNNGSNDFDSMLKMIQMINMIKGTQQSNNEPAETKPNACAKDAESDSDLNTVQAVGTLSTPFDERLQTPALQAIKAAIPYLEPLQQKNIGLFVKLYEVQQLLNIYNSEASYAASSQASLTTSRTAVLNAMRPYVAKEKQPMIDLLVRIIDIKEVYEKIKQGG